MGHGRYKLWAAGTSVLFHIVVLSVLAVTRFCPDSSEQIQTASDHPFLAAVRNITENSPVVPKPEIRGPVSSYLVTRPLNLPQQNQILASSLRDRDALAIESQSSSLAELAWSQQDSATREINFFTSRTSCKRICYLVDCSGSMKGLLQQVRDELARSIQTLQSDQYFGIIFFGDDKVKQFAAGKLVRASNEIKTNALAFFASVDASGQTNALAGFSQAVKMENENGAGPQVIMFLTDGFELSQSDAYRFRQNIIELRAQYLPDCIINTIGIWPSPADRRLLESIAGFSNGRFVCFSGENP